MWLDNFPNISLQKFALILSKMDFQDFSNGQLKLLLDSKLLNTFLKESFTLTEYIEDINVALYEENIEIDITLNIKGLSFSSVYILSIVEFNFDPNKHQVKLKIEHRQNYSTLIEKLYDFTIKPHILRYLTSNGIMIKDELLIIDLDNLEKLENFKSSFMGTLLFNNLDIKIKEYCSQGVLFNLDISALKDTLKIVVKTIEEIVREKAQKDLKKESA